MKLFRIILLLLAGALLLTACNPSSTPSDESEDTPSADPGATTHLQTLVSVGKPYTYSTAPNATYVDTFGIQLTDGQKIPDFAAFYTDVRMVGFNSSTNFIIDLGDDGKRINTIVARSLDLEQDGVRMARAASFFGSDDQKKWERLGTSAFASNGVRTIGEARLELEEPVDFRYVRIMITMGQGAAFFFLDELEVYADVPAKEKPDTVTLAYQNEQLDHAAWKALSTGKAATPVSTENVARSLSYTFEGCSFDERAPQNETLLTDGDPTAQLFGENVWVGFRPEGDAAPTLTFDLGSTRDDLYAFRLYALNGGLSVSFPDAVDVYASEDGKTYTPLGRMYAPPACDNFTYTLILSEYIRARYIRFAFTGATEDYWWLEEAEIIAGSDETVSDEFYPPVSFPTVTEELFWDSAESDYRETQNLLLGLTQQMAASFYEDTATAMIKGESGETPADTTFLTDGEEPVSSYCYSSGWFFHRGGGALNVFYDIGKLSTVDILRVRLLEQTAWGISRPTHITAFLSEDAVHWYPVAQYDRGDEELNSGATRMTFELTPETPLAARFVRFRIESGMLFMDELEAIGTKEVRSDAVRLADSGLKSYLYYAADENAEHANPENTPIKAKDIALVFGEKGDETSLLPLVAYLDKDGNIKDTLMDGFAYCPTGALPSGAGAHNYTKKIDWDFLFDNTFNGHNGFNKLDEVVGQVKDALNRPDYTVQVYCTLLFLHPDVTDFGDVDGDGVTENLSSPEGRRKVLDWYLHRCMDEFSARGYKNLEFGGFYWVNEAVTWEWDDTYIIKEVADYVHEVGSYFLWIPYYTAHRYFLGYELGFDIVCMQPNYVFDLDSPFYRVPATAALTKAQGMCVEIEHTFQAKGDPTYARFYMQYLQYGALTGYMGATHIYYDDLYNFSEMAYSDSPLCRMQYDATYAFAKETLEITPDPRAELSFSTAADTLLRGTIAPEGDETPTLYTLVCSPAHGSVSLTEDGRFVYCPEKGYTGTDTFTYTYNHFLGESEVCTVTINIG